MHSEPASASLAAGANWTSGAFSLAVRDGVMLVGTHAVVQTRAALVGRRCVVRTHSALRQRRRHGVWPVRVGRAWFADLRGDGVLIGSRGAFRAPKATLFRAVLAISARLAFLQPLCEVVEAVAERTLPQFQLNALRFPHGSVCHGNDGGATFTQKARGAHLTSIDGVDDVELILRKAGPALLSKVAEFTDDLAVCRNGGGCAKRAVDESEAVWTGYETIFSVRRCLPLTRRPRCQR
eukprot:2007354-Rhodomonas_salina.4